jgi:uncharacterized protein YdeI (YjbR/CyaY-like superfamily)
MKPKFFSDQHKFRAWLQKYHGAKTELLVGFYKVNSGKASMTWSQSVDQAICFGWIDGVRRTIDDKSYSIRFTPRKQNSIWSAINIKKVADLTKAGSMTNAGKIAFARKKDHLTNLYSHEKEPAILDSKYEKQFKKNKKAWSFFSTQAPSYKKVITHWIMSAKKEETQKQRLKKAIDISSEQKRKLF